MTAALAYLERRELAEQTASTNADPSEPRLRRCVSLHAEISLESESQFFTALGAHPTAAGVFVATYSSLPVGCRVTLSLTLPDGELLASGTVRWVRDVSSGASPGLGIGFEGLAGDAARRIARFCAARPPLLHDDDDAV